MPQRILCQRCGAVLYEGVDLKPPDEIVQSHDGKCPKCGKKLSFIPTNVKIKSIANTNRRLENKPSRAEISS